MFYDILPDGTTDPEAYQAKLDYYRQEEATRLQLVHAGDDWNLKQRQAAADEYARRQLLALLDSPI